MTNKGIKRSQINCAMLLLIMMQGAFSSGTNTLASHVADTLGIAQESVGLFTTFYSFGMVAGSIFSSMVTERIGKRRLICIGAFIGSGCLLLQAFSGMSLPLFLAGSVIGGFGFPLCEANGNALLGDNNPGKESSAINIAQMFYAAVAIVIPIAVIWFVGTGSHSWKTVYILMAIVFAAIGIYTFLLKDIDSYDISEKTEEKDRIKISALFKDKFFVLLCIMILLMTCYESMAVAYGKLYLIDKGILENIAVIGVSLYQAGTTLGRFICIFLSGKEQQGTKVLSIFAPVGLALILFSPSTFLRIAGMAFLGLGTGPVWPLLFVLVIKRVPEHTAVAGSVFNTFLYAGYIIWPTLIGVLLSSATSTLTVCFILAALVFVLSLIVTKKSKYDDEPAKEE